MPRRRILNHLGKYVVMFFTIVMVFFWVNHSSVVRQQIRSEIKRRMKTTPSINNTRFKERLMHLSRMIKKRRSTTMDDAEAVDLNQEIMIPKIASEFQFKDKDISTSKPTRYFVNNAKCKMPYADPYSREALEIYSPFKLKSCANDTDLFELTYDIKSQHYQLSIQKQARNKLGHLLMCNYRQVLNGGKDPSKNTVTGILSLPTYFENSCTLPKGLNGIIAECVYAQNNTRLQQDAIPVLQVQNKVSKADTHPLERQPSVILLGLDSVSKMNFQRTMPKTANFVSRAGWYEMEGYNKVGDNTVDNLLPVLMGYTLKESPVICSQYAYGCWDKFPWIWKDYKKAGYTVALGEDLSHLGIMFRDSLADLQNAAVDHSLRPLLLAIEENMKVYKRLGYNYCIGRRLTVSYVFDFCQQFISRYIEELNQPIFGFFFSATITHDFNFGAGSLDAKFVEYLEQFNAHHLFEQAIVILFSDHGARFGELMDLSDSYLEERLPMLHIYLPPWFRETYPEYAAALYTNRNRLSSNYDLHKTLRHIIELTAKNPAQLTISNSCPSSQSLLHPLPEARGCEDACIGEHWCTCKEYIEQERNGHVYYMTKLLIYHINSWMLQQQFNKVCQRILLDDVEYSERKVLSEDYIEQNMYGSISTYRLRFRTYPGKALYQATIRYNRQLNALEDFDINDVSRLDSYRYQSTCVDHAVAKKFCICYPKEKDTFMENWHKQKLVTKL